MREYTILRLNGGFASSYGREASTKRRPTGTLPGKSWLVGLLGRIAGLDDGKDEDVDTLYQWQRRLRSASIVVHQGTLFTDYQNAHPRKNLEKHVPTGLLYDPSDPWSKGDNKQIWKTYICDHDVIVALRFDDEHLPSPEEVYSWSLRPARVPYVGRQCCTLARPLSSAGRPRKARSAAEAALSAAVEVIEADYPDAKEEDRLDYLLDATWDEGEGPSVTEEGYAASHLISDLRLWEIFNHGGSRSVVSGKLSFEDFV